MKFFSNKSHLGVYIFLALFFSACGSKQDSGAEVQFVGLPATSTQLWPGGIVPYVVAPGFEWNDAIENAKRELQRTQKVRLIPRTNQTDYVFLTHDRPHHWTSNACGASYVGRVGGKQPLWVRKDEPNRCLTFRGSRRNEIFLHEVLHALGGYHENDGRGHRFSPTSRASVLNTDNPGFVVTEKLDQSDIDGLNAQYSQVRSDSQVVSRNSPTEVRRDTRPPLPRDFSVHEYAACNLDLLRAFGAKWDEYRNHWRSTGHKENGRRYKNCFDSHRYVASFYDLVRSDWIRADIRSRAIEHFATVGWREAGGERLRLRNQFNCWRYAEGYPDLQNFYNASRFPNRDERCRELTRHYTNSGWREGTHYSSLTRRLEKGRDPGYGH